MLYGADATLFPNDPMPAAASKMASLYWPVMGWFAKVIPLETLLLLVFIFTRILFFVGLAYWVKGVVGEDRLLLVVILGFAATAPKSVFGWGTITDEIAEQTSLAVALLLFAFGALWRGYRVVTALLYIAVLFTNILYGVFAFPILVAIDLYRQKRLSRSNCLYAGSLFLSFLAVMMIVKSPSTESQLSFDELLLQFLDRSSHHLVPFGMYLGRDLAGLALLLIVGTTAVLGLFLRGPCRPLAILLLSLTVMLCLGLLIAQLAPSGLIPLQILKLQPARFSDLWFLFSLPVVSLILRQLAVEHRAPLIYLATVVASLAVGGIVLGRLRGEPIFTVLLMGPLLAVLATIMLLSLLPQIRRPIVAAFMLLPFTVAIVSIQQRIAANHVSITKDYRPIFLKTSPQQREIVEIGELIKGSVPPDGLILVNPFRANIDLLRIYTQRSLFVAWKDGTVGFHDLGYTDAFTDRLHQLGLQSGELGRGRRPSDGVVESLLLQNATKLNPRPTHVLLDTIKVEDERWELVAETENYRLYRLVD